MHQPVSYIQQTKNLYDSLGYEAYRWFRADTPTAFVKPPLPLSRSKLGLVSTAGTYLAGQIAYHYKDDRMESKLDLHTVATNKIHTHRE